MPATVYNPMRPTHQTSNDWVLPLLRPTPLASSDSMPRRLLRGRAYQQKQQQPSSLEIETEPADSPASPPNTRKRKREEEEAQGTDSGYQTEDSSYEPPSEPRRLRPRRGSVNYRVVPSPTSSFWSLSPTTPIASNTKKRNPPRSARPSSSSSSSKPEFRGHGLVLCFQDTDLPVVSEEICEAFRAIQCSAKTIYMDSEDFDTSFQDFLNMESSQPRIIYVQSHGVGTSEDNLDICSHGSHDEGITMPWTKIQGPIDRAQCDVLVLLTCCHGGLAKISSSTPHAKELIATASWADSTFAYLGSLAVKIALNRWYWTSSELTGQGLHEVLTRVIKEIREEDIRKGHERVTLLQAQEKSLEDEISRLERDLRELTRSCSPPPPSGLARRATASKREKRKTTSGGSTGSDTNLNKVDDSGKITKRQASPGAECGGRSRNLKIIEGLLRTKKRLLKEVVEDRIEEEEILEENKRYYTQPHFMRAEGGTRLSGPFSSRGTLKVWKF